MKNSRPQIHHLVNYGSLFSGIEAASLAFSPLGWTPKWFAENDEFCCKVLSHHWSHVPNLGDVTNPSFVKRAEKVDLIIGGSPCPSFSVAGKRRGMLDERGVLTLRYIELVRELKPTWFIWENVVGVTTSDNGNDFKVVLDEMVKSGYGVSWRVLDARSFGLPQSRRRVYVVGRLGEECPEEILFDGKVGQDAAGEHGQREEGDPIRDQKLDGIPFALRGRETGYVMEYLSHFGCLRAVKGVGMGFLWDGTGLRKVTPMECERLMGMPDNHTNIPGATDEQRWKAIGNSMAVPVLASIGNRINYTTIKLETKMKTKNKLEKLEQIIEAGENAAVESGKALKTIRDERLYKPTFNTFDLYLSARWKFTRQRAAQLIQLATLSASLSTVVDIGGIKERHIREIGKLPEDRQVDAVKRFCALPKEDQTTSAMIGIVQQTELTAIGKEPAPLVEQKPDADIHSPIGWYGGKFRLRKFINYLLPPHTTYIEPFFGAGSVLFGKSPSPVEIVSDVNHGVVSFFSVLRDSTKAAELQRRLTLTPYSREEHRICGDPTPTGDEIEDARRFFVRARQSYASIEVGAVWSLNIGRNLAGRAHDFARKVDELAKVSERLRTVQIESRSFEQLLPKCDEPGTVVYADPPYPKSVRDGNTQGYRHEMSDAQHSQLLDIVKGYKHAKVLISGYRCPMYDQRLDDWNRHEKLVTINANSGEKGCGKPKRLEVVWTNY